MKLTSPVARKKALIPILIDGSEPASGLAYYLSNVQWLDYVREGERALDRISNQSKKAPDASVDGRPQTPTIVGKWYSIEEDVTVTIKPDGTYEKHPGPRAAISYFTSTSGGGRHCWRQTGTLVELGMFERGVVSEPHLDLEYLLNVVGRKVTRYTRV